MSSVSYKKPDDVSGHTSVSCTRRIARQLVDQYVVYGWAGLRGRLIQSGNAWGCVDVIISSRGQDGDSASPRDVVDMCA